MSNRLAKESSPYLLQHGENPVDWYPWGEEAFQKAKEEDKPIFLSIGYSTCHWCHVMAHESFENHDIAELLNREFISIKVDREERPDVDNIYMSFCQAFTGSGGWPTTIFMTGDQQPFFAGTYFPPNTRGNMLGFRELLEIIAEKWHTERPQLLQQAEEIVSAIKQESSGKKRAQQGKADIKLADTAVELYRRSHDEAHGGFGRAPKFPMPHNLLFLMDYYERYQDKHCLEMVEHTLEQMYRGGLFDHIGFGFCRYSTDKQFLVPHFEKMLYDNALLILAYCRAYTITQKVIYRDIAEKTASYILGEMTSPEGGFYSAQDADIEGEEGKYYLFTPDEIISVLGREAGEAFNTRYDISKKGNFEGENIPNLLHRKDWAKADDPHLSKLAEYRRQRYSLHLDDKILTAWNGLMISAMCSLYRISGNNRYLLAAKKAHRFILENSQEGDLLFVSYRQGKRGVMGFLDDYAAIIYASLALYGVTLESEYLSQANILCQRAVADFRDEKGGFYLYSDDSEQLIMRPKETYDGAIPSGNSIMAWNLVRLWHITGNPYYEKEARLQLDFLATEAADYPTGHSLFLSALLEMEDPPTKVTTVLAEPSVAEPPSFVDNLPFSVPTDAILSIRRWPSDEYPLKDGKTTFYVCQGRQCLPPVNRLSDIVWQDNSNSPTRPGAPQ